MRANLRDILRDDILDRVTRGIVDNVPVPFDPRQNTRDVVGDVLPEEGSTFIKGDDWNKLLLELYDGDLVFSVNTDDGAEGEVTVEDIEWNEHGVIVHWRID